MIELIVSSFVILGNPQGIWSPNSSVWFLPSTPPGDEQLYEPILETFETEEK